MENYSPTNQNESENVNFRASKSFLSNENLLGILGATMTIGGTLLSGAAIYELFSNEDVSQLIQRHTEKLPEILKNTLQNFDKLSLEAKAFLGMSASSWGTKILLKNRIRNDHE